MWMYYPYKLFS